MKKLVLLSAVLGIAGTAAFGQGTVALLTSSLNAYVKFSNTVSQTFYTSASVPALAIGVYSASDAATLQSGGGSLFGGSTLATLNFGGYINGSTGGGNKTDVSRAGLTTYFQLRAWTGGYATYAEAIAAGQAAPNTVWATLLTAPVVSANPTADSLALVPTLAWNPGSSATSMALGIPVSPVVPEPSVIALGVLGLAGALFIRRRK